MSSLVFILGGAASGKSLYAEKCTLAQSKSRGTAPVYIATALGSDAEMCKKIQRHKQRRDETWALYEHVDQLEKTLDALPPLDVALLDCVTMWLGHIFYQDETDAALSRGLDAINRCKATLFVVSNEVGHGIVPATKDGRAFRNLQGRVNQQIAALADTAVLVTAGLPLCLKGTLPDI